MTDNGVTITLGTDLTCGTFANGEPWCVIASGTINITDLSPLKDTNLTLPDLHGCMVNPMPPGATTAAQAVNLRATQGWDSRMIYTGNGTPYSAALNKCRSFPFTVTFGQTLVAVQSNPTECPGSKGERCATKAGVFTFLQSAPAAGSFRPPWMGTDKTIVANVSAISSTRLDKFKDFSSAGLTPLPTLAYSQTCLHLPILQLDGQTESWKRHMPAQNSTCGQVAYGRQMSNEIGKVLIHLFLNNSDAEKLPIAIDVAQQAIDMYGAVNAGLKYGGLGGFAWSNRELLIIGASLLNHDAMFTMATDNALMLTHTWGTDTQYGTVTQDDINTPRTKAGATNFTQAMLGYYFWCSSVYINRDQCSATWTGSPAPAYTWMPTFSVANSLYIRWLGFTSYGWTPWINFTDGVNSTNGSGVWMPYRMTHLKTGALGDGCTSTLAATEYYQMRWVCDLWTTQRNSTPIDGSPDGSEPPPPPEGNAPPTVLFVTPAVDTYQLGATIAISGTAADSDGTVSSITITSPCDASITNTGTAAAWAATVDIPGASICPISVVATDNDAATGGASINVLRVQARIDPDDHFTLTTTNGITWPAINPGTWTQMVGTISWAPELQARSTTAARNFALHNVAIGSNDQGAECRITSTPVAQHFHLCGVRGSINGATYSGYAFTAELGKAQINVYVNGALTILSTITTYPMGHSLAGQPVTWTANDVIRGTAIDDDLCHYQNGEQLGCVTNSALASGGGWMGLWGTSATMDDVVFNAESEVSDTTPPVISITTPASNPLVIGAAAYTAFAGTVTDDTAVTSCTWTNVTTAVTDACGGTLPDFSIASITAVEGDNLIRIEACDAAMNCATQERTLTYVVSGFTFSMVYPGTQFSYTVAAKWIHLQGEFTGVTCDQITVASGEVNRTAVGVAAWLAFAFPLDVGFNLVTVDCIVDDAVVASGTVNVTLSGLLLRL